MSYASEVLADAPLAFYPMAETSGAVLVDDSGNGRNGVIDAGVVLGAANFLPSEDDSTSWLLNAFEGGSVPGAAWMTPAAFTYEVPVYLTAYDSDGTVIAARADVGTANSRAAKAWAIQISGTGAVLGRIYSNTNVTVVPQSAAGAVPLNTPCIVAIRQDATSVQFLVNGVVVANAALAGGPVSFANNSKPLTLGKSDNASGNSGAYTFQGRTMGHAFFGTALSDARLLAHYEAAMVGPPPPPPPEDFAGSWSWWTRPRVVSLGGKTFVGLITQAGEIAVDEYDAATGNRLQRHIVKTGVTFDDHNNPALVIEPGQPPIVIWNKHAATSSLHYSIGTQAIELGFTSGPEKTLGMGGAVTYCAAHVLDGVIYLVSRVTSSTWRYVASTDWGTTWGTVKKFASFSTQGYVASKRVGNRLRLAASAHPRELTTLQQIYYAELELTTGNIYNRAGALLGVAGVSDPAVTAWDQAAVPTVANYKTWVYDVSDGPAREIVWGQMESSDNPVLGTYQYTTDASGAWVTRQVDTAGLPFGDEASSNNGGNYLGGAQFVGDRELIVSREEAGTWTVDRRTTADDGATWDAAVLATDAIERLARAWPAETRDLTTADYVAINEVTPPFTSYVSHTSRILLVSSAVEPPPPEGSAVSWWDGAAVQPAEVLGWWDGAAVQPVEVLGHWDGAAIQPLV